MLIEDRESDAQIHLDFVPMADVLFNLLIFFLLATTIAQVEREMPIALPFGSSGMPISAAMQEMVINVDAKGQMFLGATPVSGEDLAATIRRTVSENPQQKVTVRGDRTTAYANVVAALDLCKTSGIQEPYLDTVLSN